MVPIVRCAAFTFRKLERQRAPVDAIFSRQQSFAAKNIDASAT